LNSGATGTTSVEAATVPTEFSQVRRKEASWPRGPVLKEPERLPVVARVPESASAPLSLFVSAQERTFWADQFTVADWPETTRGGLAEIDTEGMSTVTVSFAVAERPYPFTQETEYEDVVEGETETLPEVAPPVVKPVPVQEAVLAEVQARVQEAPCSMGFGSHLRVAEGERTVTAAFAVAVPPSPVQATE
jgi:hypothetical protein